MDLKSKLKQLRQIKDIAEFNSENIGKNFQYAEIEYIDTSSVTEGRLTTIQKLERKKSPSRAKRLVKNNDIVISTVRPNLKHYYFVKNAQKNLVVSTGFVVIRPIEVDPLYLYYYLITPMFIEYLVGVAESHTSAYPSFPPEIIENAEIDLPDENIQKKIGKILYDLDSQIENLQKQNKILEQIIQSIFKSWFVDFDGQTEFVDSELGKIPKGWKVVPFKEMASCVKGFSYKGIEKFDEPQGFEFVTLNSIKEGGGFKKKFTWLESNRLKERHYVKEMDLIIANTEQTKDARLLATPAIVQFSYNYDKQLAVYSHHISKIEPKIQNVKFYLYSFFLYYQQIIANAYHTGTGVWGFDHTSFEINHLTLQPTHEILKKLEKNAFVIHAKNIENEKSISLLIFIRDFLLPKLMSGEIRV